MIEVREYVDEKGKSPFAKWIRNLNVVAAAKVTTALERIDAARANWKDYKRRKP